jgi:hypothetical protein
VLRAHWLIGVHSGLFETGPEGVRTYYGFESFLTVTRRLGRDLSR